jgi:hypothetical protein
MYKGTTIMSSDEITEIKIGKERVGIIGLKHVLAGSSYQYNQIII